MNPTWRDLYLATLFETDKTEIASRIEIAEQAIILRSRELFALHEKTSEHDLLEAALIALHALRSCSDLGLTRDRQAA